MKNGITVEENLVALIAKIGEKITIGKTKTIEQIQNEPKNLNFKIAQKSNWTNSTGIMNKFKNEIKSRKNENPIWN